MDRYDHAKKILDFDSENPLPSTLNLCVCANANITNKAYFFCWKQVKYSSKFTNNCTVKHFYVSLVSKALLQMVLTYI
jgi:hypothetical protein